MELDDAIHTAILTLKEGYATPRLIAYYFRTFLVTNWFWIWTCRYEGQISANNIEIGIIRADREFKYVKSYFIHFLA
jgi:20S proteasome subunit alpha 2